MGRDFGGMEIVTLKTFSEYTNDILVLGVDSALSYLGYGTSDYMRHPIFVIDTLECGQLVRGMPWIVGVRSIGELLDTSYRNIKVTTLVDSILDTIDFNKYSEHLMHALAEIEGDVSICRELTHKAERRGLGEVLEWEWKEMRGYYNY